MIIDSCAKQRRAVAKSWQFWAAFAIWQTLGAGIPAFTNIHSSIWPLFAGLMLIPGIAVLFVSNFLPLWAGMSIAIGVNAVVWFVLATAWDAAQPKQSA